ncbi:DUF4296 domain-containing protein [Bacteroides gallinaceum]|uniref:DUF4296 domain-containing protein n=1 Tax=Bacteroides gallinaceum TaxID=1462571 RepID=A0ABT7X2H6_9BACE|nr:DUF4296 domain-containing protein [Bacteroides gallinaceum]MDN0048262.1 DUF4296 domain-containing protein [Bacteroides gallinaceum]MDN0078636.1 DUF4296 domain-containing protein [Bacteroides gallinaceum]
MRTTTGLYVVLALGLLASCGKKIPDDIIQPDAMESLLYDYHLASTMSASLPYAESYKKDAYLDYVFQKHQVTEAEFDSSMVWYTRHAEELATIYRSLQERLEKEEKQMKEVVAKRDNQIDVSMSGDTVDVWQDRPLYWLSASPLTNKVVFDLKTDTTFKPYDAMELKADFHFIPSSAKQSGKAVMALNFYFDNDSVQGLTRMVTHSGMQRLYLRPDSAFAIQSISGFVYFMDEESTGTSLLVNDIHLTRYHVKEKEAVSVPDTVAVRDTSRLERKERVVGRSQIQPVRKIENRK